MPPTTSCRFPAAPPHPASSSPGGLPEGCRASFPHPPRPPRSAFFARSLRGQRTRTLTGSTRAAAARRAAAAAAVGCARPPTRRQRICPCPFPREWRAAWGGVRCRAARRRGFPVLQSRAHVGVRLDLDFLFSNIVDAHSHRPTPLPATVARARATVAGARVAFAVSRPCRGRRVSAARAGGRGRGRPLLLPILPPHTTAPSHVSAPLYRPGLASPRFFLFLGPLGVSALLSFPCPHPGGPVAT